MNEELQAKVVEYLGSIENVISSGGNFVAEKAPETIQQYLMWGTVEALVWLIGCSLGCVFIIYLNVWMWKSESVDEDLCIPASVFFGISSIPLVIGIICSLCTIIKIAVAPNVYLLENLVRVIK